MAETYNPGLLPRTYFRAPRVPFDFRALALAILGYLVWWAGGLLWGEIFSIEDFGGVVLGAAEGLFRGLPFIGREISRLIQNVFGVDLAAFADADYSFWEVFASGIWFFGVWAFFALGIHRITALRIARDEGLSLGEALKFSFQNWPTLLLVPPIIAGAIGFFFLCNMAGGLLISIPFLGGLLALVIVPLAAVSTLLILLIGIGGIFGLPLIGSAAAWECNGSLDAISRAFSYLFARPLQYFWNFFLIFLLTGVILLVGHWFTYTLVKTVDSGVAFDGDMLSVIIDAPAPLSFEGSDYDELSTDAKELMSTLREKNPGYTPGASAPGAEPYARNISTVGEVGIGFALNALIFWVVLNLIWLGVFGYAVYWLIGASTSVYADLRADVDGTEEDEIYIEEEEQDLDALAEGGPVSEPPPATDGPKASEAPADEPAKEPEAPADEASESGGEESEGESGDSGASGGEDKPAE